MLLVVFLLLSVYPRLSGLSGMHWSHLCRVLLKTTVLLFNIALMSLGMTMKSPGLYTGMLYFVAIVYETETPSKHNFIVRTRLERFALTIFETLKLVSVKGHIIGINPSVDDV